MTALDLAGRELWFEERPVAASAAGSADVLTLVRDEVRRLERGRDRRCSGSPSPCPGLIDRAPRRVVDAPNLGWPT